MKNDTRREKGVMERHNETRDRERETERERKKEERCGSFGGKPDFNAI